MLADYAYFLLLLCFFTSLYGCISAIISARWQHKVLFKSSTIAQLCCTGTVILASGILLYSFIISDYHLAYVYKNSSNDLPLRFKISAFWASLEGSHLLWALLLSIFSSWAHLSYRRENEHYIPYVSAILQAVLSWMFYLAVFHSDPFATQQNTPNGVGLNELLQNNYMIFHPPSLFTGYSTLAIPYAYSIAALFYGGITSAWLPVVRRWTIFSWVFLSIGMFLGGRWAYVELGWGGYWAWDPVENSVLLPWLCNTAMIHSLIVQGRTGYLKNWTIFLSSLAFFFSFFGTFITRSGIISSIHSFAQSPVGENYFYYISVIAIFTSTVHLMRYSKIKADDDKQWNFSKESILLISQFLLISFIGVVFIGTLYPIISEYLTGERFHIQAPYFNSFAPYIGAALITAISIGAITKYGDSGISKIKKIIIYGLIIASPITLLFAWAGDIHLSSGANFYIQIFGVELVAFAFVILSYALVKRFQDQNLSIAQFTKANLAYIGAFLAHLGILAAILGFLGNYRGIEKTITLEQGESTNLYGYNFQFMGMGTSFAENVKFFEAKLTIYDNYGNKLGNIAPAKALYPTKNELFHEVDVWGGFWREIYASLSAFEPENMQKATIQIYINHTVKLVWISIFLMALGGFLALLQKQQFKGIRET